MNTLETTPDTAAAASPLGRLIGPCLRGAVFVAQFELLAEDGAGPGHFGQQRLALLGPPP